MKKVFLFAAATIALVACQNKETNETAETTTAETEVATIVEDPVPVAEPKDSIDTEGYTTLPSGLQYKVIVDAKGPKPSATDEVTVHYTGKLLNGKVFDSSVKRGEPATFPLNRVIKGWTEGLQLMSEGAKYQFIIPSDLAYGENGAGGMIGPNETLYFEVELIKINK